MVPLRFHRFAAVMLLSPGLSTFSAGKTFADEQSRATVLSPAEDTPVQAMIRARLTEPVTVEFVETPISDVMDFFREITRVNIVLDRNSLEKEGVTSDTPVTIHVEQVRLISALNLLLRPLNLTWLIRNDCLIITSNIAALDHVVPRAYRVDDIVPTAEDAAKLLTMLQRIAYADETTSARSAGRIQYMESLKMVVVTDNEAVHTRVTTLLDQLRGAAGAEAFETVQKIQRKLGESVTVEFVETPLNDTLDFLRELTRVNIVVDRVSLEEEGVTTDTPLTIHVEQIPLRSALTLLLTQLNLTTIIDNECLVITSEAAEIARRHANYRVYPVGKMLGNNAKITGDEWTRLLSGLAACPAAALTKKSEPDSPAKGQPAGPFVGYFAPTASLVVIGPESLHKEVENLISLVVKTAQARAD